MQFDSLTVFQRNIQHPHGVVDDEIVLLDINRGEYYNLNNVGSYIWKSLEAPKSLADLIDLITADYEVSREDCTNEIYPFLENLINLDIIHVLNG